MKAVSHDPESWQLLHLDRRGGVHDDGYAGVPSEVVPGSRWYGNAIQRYRHNGVYRDT
jgi:hypothetical protein